MKRSRLVNYWMRKLEKYVIFFILWYLSDYSQIYTKQFIFGSVHNIGCVKPYPNRASMKLKLQKLVYFLLKLLLTVSSGNWHSFLTCQLHFDNSAQC